MRPNILFLYADQLVHDALGCTGHPLIETPHLDALAAGGAVFDAAYSNAPVCTPYRACLFSGTYANQIGALDNGAALPTDRPCLADCLNEADYATCHVGKWHLGGNGQGPIDASLRGGFQGFIGYQCYNDYTQNVAFYDESGQEHRSWNHRTEATAQIAIDRLRGLAEQDRPFALFVSWQNPHYPLQPTAGWRARYHDVDMPLRPNQDPDIDPYTGTWSPRSAQPPERDPDFQRYGGDLQRYLRHYAAMVSLLDEQVGRVLAWLRILGLEEETLVVFTADHGECQGSHGWQNKSRWWEESARIPQIMRGPGIEPGSRIAAPVGCVDFFPTFCGLAGTETPTHCVGSDLRPLFTDAGTQRPPLVAEMKDWALVREGDQKLVVAKQDWQPLHHFDLHRDPYEQHDLLDKPDAAATRERLYAHLQAWARSCGLVSRM